jgi:alpha/beta superfamily hydrolase
MTTATQNAIETIRRQLRSLRAVAGNVAEGIGDWQDAEALDSIADAIKEQLEAIELDAAEAIEDHPALDRAA